MKRIVPVVFILIAALCIWLILKPSPSENEGINVIPQTRIIAPLTSGVREQDERLVDSESLAIDDLMSPKIALGSDEQLVSIITQDIYGDQMDEQIIAVRNPDQADSQVYLILVEYDEYTNGYHRMEKVATSITRPRTFSMFTRDLLGDRSTCVIASGMNSTGEQVMAIFRLRRSIPGTVLAEVNMQRILSLVTDGSITIQETERSQAYLQGYTAGIPFNISTYSRDSESANVLDQIETIYSWEAGSGRYERSGTARIAGAQIEQKMLHEILDGTAEKFEQFLDGMWTRLDRDGSSNALASESLYFDLQRRELTFQTGNNQEVYTWQNPIPMRYGLYMTCRNMSIPTLRRLINIELSSMDTIRIRVREDIRIKLGFGGQWESLYQKSSTDKGSQGSVNGSLSYELGGEYRNGEISLVMYPDMRYVYRSPSFSREGVFSQFSAGSSTLVEFRPAIEENGERGTYTVSQELGTNGTVELILDHVRLGVRGMERLYERPLRFTKEP